MEEKREKSGAEAEFPAEEPSPPLMGVVTSFKNFIIPMSFALHRKSFKLFQLFFRFFRLSQVLKTSSSPCLLPCTENHFYRVIIKDCKL